MYLRDSKPMFDSMHEECGVFGVYSTETRDVANTVYYGLYALQHRGQESCGIAVAYANKVEYHDGGESAGQRAAHRLYGQVRQDGACA